MTALNQILRCLTQSPHTAPILPLRLSDASGSQDGDTTQHNLNAAFLIVLAGDQHPDYVQARNLLSNLATSPDWGSWAEFYLKGVQLIETEQEERGQLDPKLAETLQKAEIALADPAVHQGEITELIWSVLFPEGTGIRGQEADRIRHLRKQRMVTIHQLNPTPIQDPAKQVLFTSNVLLTKPLASTDLSGLDPALQAQLAQAAQEPQSYWYDHPIPIGIGIESNEILYGLKNLNHAMEIEHQRHPNQAAKVNCVLSVSVTHKSLNALGKRYIQEILETNGPLEQLNIFAFTETDTEALIQQVLLPIVEQCCPTKDAAELLSIFGVDGRYDATIAF